MYSSLQTQDLSRKDNKDINDHKEEELLTRRIRRRDSG